jgi:outer membrane protein OmpA-like peptidoglycan-associated protein
MGVEMETSRSPAGRARWRARYDLSVPRPEQLRLLAPIASALILACRGGGTQPPPEDDVATVEPAQGEVEQAVEAAPSSPPPTSAESREPEVPPCLLFESVVPRGRCQPAHGSEYVLSFDERALGDDEATQAGLARLVELVAASGDAKLEIGVHTASPGRQDVNQEISEARARALREALIARGADPERLEAVGYGEQRPIITNEGCDLSRRVELRRVRDCR